MTTLFESKAPWIMALLLQDFPALEVEDAAAILGNIGGETGGFRLMQEVKPLVKGSRGGYGWCQWTGPRRRQFEAYCERNGLDPHLDLANYKFLWCELSGAIGSEGGALARTRAFATLDGKTEAFMRAFLRPGIPHLETRQSYARLALAAYRVAERNGPIAIPNYPLTDTGVSPVDSIETKPWYQSKTVMGAILMVAAQIASGAFGVDITQVDLTAAVDHLDTIATAVGGLIIIWGRITATKQITTKP